MPGSVSEPSSEAFCRNRPVPASVGTAGAGLEPIAEEALSAKRWASGRFPDLLFGCCAQPLGEHCCGIRVGERVQAEPARQTADEVVGPADLDPTRAHRRSQREPANPDLGHRTRFGVDAEDAPPGDVTVDCRGLAARDRVPDLRGVRGEMLVLRCREVALTRTVRLLHPRFPLYVVPRARETGGEGIYMVGATSIESASRSPVSARSLMELLGAAYALHPAFGEAEVVEIGVDARPAFPDNLPRAWREGDRVLVNGLYRHGFLLAPAMARRAADLVFNERTAEEGDADRLERQAS